MEGNETEGRGGERDRGEDKVTGRSGVMGANPARGRQDNFRGSCPAPLYFCALDSCLSCLPLVLALLASKFVHP